MGSVYAISAASQLFTIRRKHACSEICRLHHSNRFVAQCRAFRASVARRHRCSFDVGTDVKNTEDNPFPHCAPRKFHIRDGNTIRIHVQSRKRQPLAPVTILTHDCIDVPFSSVSGSLPGFIPPLDAYLYSLRTKPLCCRFYSRSIA